MVKRKRAAYRDLAVWDKSVEFVCIVFKLVEQLDAGERKHYRLVEQLESAAASIAMNIAEGKGRWSKKEFSHFLVIARGSLYETMTLLEIMKRVGWISGGSCTALELRADEIARMINGLRSSLRS